MNKLIQNGHITVTYSFKEEDENVPGLMHDYELVYKDFNAVIIRPKLYYEYQNPTEKINS